MGYLRPVLLGGGVGTSTGSLRTSISNQMKYTAGNLHNPLRTPRKLYARGNTPHPQAIPTWPQLLKYIQHRFKLKQHLPMRDALAEATTCIYKFRKRSPGRIGLELSLRPLSAAWQCRPLFDSDKNTIEGAQIKIREDGVGRESDACISKIATGANIENAHLRATGPCAKTPEI